MDMAKLRLGWIGCGGIAKSHANQMAPLADRIEVTRTVDLLEDRARAMAQVFPGAQPATDYREVMGDVDAVLISLPHDLHADVTIDFLNAGKHVLCEKPMANNEADCRRMIDAAASTEQTLMIAYCMRYHPLVRKLKELLDAKAYGDVFQLSIWTEQHTHYPEGHWGLEAYRLGGGQFFSHGCHYVDLLLWYLGAPRRGLHMGTNFGTPWMQMEGTSNVTLEFENGAMGYHFGTWGAKGSRLRYSYHAHCTQGMLELDVRAGKLMLHQDKQVTVLAEAPPQKPMTLQMTHFIDSIDRGEEPETDAISSLEGLRVIWKLYEAERRHTMADLTGEGLGTWSPQRSVLQPATSGFVSPPPAAS